MLSWALTILPFYYFLLLLFLIDAPTAEFLEVLLLAIWDFVIKQSLFLPFVAEYCAFLFELLLNINNVLQTTIKYIIWKDKLSNKLKKFHWFV